MFVAGKYKCGIYHAKAQQQLRSTVVELIRSAREARMGQPSVRGKRDTRRYAIRTRQKTMVEPTLNVATTMERYIGSSWRRKKAPSARVRARSKVQGWS